MAGLMNAVPSSSSSPPASLTREEFDEFLNVFTHEIRNRLNVVGLEASDLAEQLEGDVDISRLQERVRECSEYLKQARDLLVPDDSAKSRLPLGEVIARLRAGGE